MCYNPNRVLLPGLYAEATITLEKKDDALAVPLQAVDQSGDTVTVDLVDAVQQNRDSRTWCWAFRPANDAEVLSGLQEGEWWWSATAAA